MGTNGGGGVTVLYWDRSIGIKIWDLKRNDVPSVFTKTTTSISDSDLDALGTPAAYFPFGCDVCTPQTFNDNQIVINIALCGDWAGEKTLWSSSGCAASTGYSSCSDFVRNNPSAFNNAYWDINWLKVFQSDGSSSGTPSPVSTGTDCGYIPSTCNGDLSWAVSTGVTQYPSYYSNFQDVTGVELTSATTEDMALYWFCSNANPNNNCGGLQIPCGRTCYPSTSSCGNVPDSCSGDLNWAATIGTKHHSSWYPSFESITGV